MTYQYWFSYTIYVSIINFFLHFIQVHIYLNLVYSALLFNIIIYKLYLMITKCTIFGYCDNIFISI